MEGLEKFQEYFVKWAHEILVYLRYILGIIATTIIY